MAEEIRDYCKECNLCWNVYTYSINCKKIEKYNIFDHDGFRKEVNNIISKNYKGDTFETELKTSLMYYFWSKSEWEIILKPWIDDGKEVIIKSLSEWKE